jgi:dTDP-4-amino-4,6-dideoxygalactose transaminase
VYVIRSPERDELQRVLGERDIGSGIHFPIPIHLQPACGALGYREGELPHTERAARDVLSIPMYAELTQAQLERVASTILSARKTPV